MEMTPGVDQQHADRMIDSILRVARPVFFDAIGNAQLHGERRQLFLRTGHADEIRVEVANVLFQFLRCIAFRVNGDEQDLVRGSIGAIHPFESLMNLLQAVQGTGADIGAMGETEKDQRPLTAKVVEGERLSFVIDQGEIGDGAGFREHHQRRIGWLRRAPHDIPQ